MYNVVPVFKRMYIGIFLLCFIARAACRFACAFGEVSPIGRRKSSPVAGYPSVNRQQAWTYKPSSMMPGGGFRTTEHSMNYGTLNIA